MNKMFLSGYIAKDTDVIISPNSNQSVAHFPIAVRRNLKTTDYFTLTAFGAVAEFTKKHLHKGTKIFVELMVQNNNYEKDGIKYYGFDFMARNIDIAGGSRRRR